jgi:hypothetical protein
MRIEYQGVAEAQPMYGHVGYLSAAYTPDAYIARAGSGVAPLVLAGALLLAVAALKWSRRSRRMGFLPLSLAALSVAGIAAGSYLYRASPLQLTPGFARTVGHMEEAIAETDRWAAEHGRLPTPEEWRRVCQSACTDGWGREFAYRAGLYPEADGRQYALEVWGRRGSARFFALQSGWLGPDGLFGTPDDKPQFAAAFRGLPEMAAWRARAR